LFDIEESEAKALDDFGEQAALAICASVEIESSSMVKKIDLNFT
jgi:hypothetical protein